MASDLSEPTDRTITTPHWKWTDITVDSPTSDEDLHRHCASFPDFDELALRDAFTDHDLPKVDDFGDHLLVVLHGLRDDDVETYEVDCFVTPDQLLTVHRERSPATNAIWSQLEASPHLAPETTGELVASLADIMTRRLLAVADAFDQQGEELIARALDADPQLLTELTAIRSDIAITRRVVHPQREALDQLRRSTSVIVSDAARRRFSDVFDVAIRAGHGLEIARTTVSETLDAYRSAQAVRATDVNRVLTIYAAIMLPLTLVAGFFGMNHPNLPGINSNLGWLIVTSVMAAIAAVSLGVFVALGWIRRPSGRQAASTLGKGLIEAARTPVEAVVTLTALPLRTIKRPPRKAQRGGTEHD